MNSLTANLLLLLAALFTLAFAALPGHNPSAIPLYLALASVALAGVAEASSRAEYDDTVLEYDGDPTTYGQHNYGDL